MKKLILSILVSCIGLSCTKKTIVETKAAEPQQILKLDDDASESSSVRAQKYVQQAEKLLSPNGFMYAHEVLEKAFELDPTNFKVQFYMRLLKPMVLFKGFYLRVQPLLGKMTTADRNRLSLAFNSMPTGSLQSFLIREGGGLIEDEEDLQKFTLKLDAAYSEFRRFLKAEKSSIASIKLVGTENFNEYLRRCAVTRLSEKSFQISPCPFAYEIPFTLDSGDFEALQQMASGMQLFLKVFNSYQMTGALEVQAKHSAKYREDNSYYFYSYAYVDGAGAYIYDSKRTLVEFLGKYQSGEYSEEDLEQLDAYIERDPTIDKNIFTSAAEFLSLENGSYPYRDFPHVAKLLTPKKDLSQYIKAKGRLGKLKTKNYMDFYHEFGVDFLGAIKWAHKYQDYLCPDGMPTSGSRPGRLFTKGFCTNKTSLIGGKAYAVLKLLELFEMGISGKSFMIGATKDGEDSEVEINLFAAFSKPIEDLKSIVPDYNDCDSAISIEDPTLGGIFPRGAGIKIYRNEESCQ